MVEVEVAPWIKGLPVAPEYRPSEAEFVDPISFVLRIEEEAGQFGICKIVPPTVKPPRKSLLPNLYRSIAAAGKSSGKKASIGLDTNSLARSKFTTRKQELGDHTHAQTRHSKGASYTLDQFEIKAKAFSRAQVGTSRDVVPVVLEALFWKTIEEDKPVTVEYADYIPGSAFPENASEQTDGKKRKKSAVDREGWKLVNSSWNMRYLAKLQGSLLRFMSSEVQGVTSPLLYIAMLFSHWSWRTESHDLHSVDYLHMGAPKTWYVVPPGAAPAFEDVLRNQDGNSIVSPEVLVINGVPCCRLVQNPGEYVIVFPRAYNFSFSHSFNCGETSGLATPGWLKAAKLAAARKELLSRPPMVCHEKLLYQTALAFAESSNTQDIRSSRLKHKRKVGAEEAVRTEFINDMAKNQLVLDKLVSMTQARRVILKGDGGKESLSNLVNLGTIDSISLLSFVCETMEGADDEVGNDKTLGEKSRPRIDWGNVSCSVCGILCYSCVVIVQPTSKASDSIREGRLTDADNNHEKVNGQGSENGSSRNGRRRNGIKEAETDNLLPPYMMCSEHALQVSSLLQGCGGSVGLVVYHPEHETFVKNAKEFSMDMSMRCRIKDTTYDEENEQDLQLISTAIEAAERPENGWIDRVQSSFPATVSLLENSSAETDEDDTELVVEKTSKEKKVIGRWCGRAWRYDQTHAVLGGCKTASKLEDNQDDKGGHDEDTILKSDDCANLRKNCRKRKRTQMVAVWRVESEPQLDSTQISESLPSEIEAKDVKIENVAHAAQEPVDGDVKVSEPGLQTENHSFEEVPPLPPLVCKEEKENGKLEMLCPEIVAEACQPPVILDCKEEPGIQRDAVIFVEAVPQEKAGAADKTEVIAAPPEEPEKQPKVELNPAENEPVSVVITEDDGQHGAGSTLCFSNSVWHDVPISFSPTFHSSYMDEKPKTWPTAYRTPLRVGIPKRKRTQITSSMEASEDEKQLTDEDFEEEEEEGEEEEDEDQNDSDVSASSVEDDERAVDGAVDYDLESRAKRTKRKSWKALAAEDERQAKTPRRGAKKAASTSTKTPGNETMRRKLVMHSQGPHTCDFEGCTMSFRTASELALHKRNICTIKECSKRLCSHSYLMQHYRVHADDRPLKCPWKGCKKTFKWSWARTEHIRVHTGERPYACTECGKSYRFVSDFSRHKRTTGHGS